MRKEKTTRQAGWAYRHKVFIMLMAAVMVMQSLLPFTGAGGQLNAYAADVQTKSFELDITEKMIYYGDWFTRVMYFKYKDTGERERSYCMNPELVPAHEGVHTAKIYNYKNVPDEYRLLWKALYYLEGGEGYAKVADVWSSVYDYDPSDDSWTDGHERAYALSHMVVSDISPVGSSGDLHAGAENIRLKNAMIERIKKMPDPPKSFQIAVYVSGSSYQNVTGYCAPLSVTGTVEVKKVSADSAVEDNSAYSLEGAVYTVYEDASLSKKAGELVTDKKGHTDPITLEEGTYYVKETKASKGYKLDEKTYKVKVEADQNEVVTSKETPKKGSLKLIKYSDSPEHTDGNSHYSLAGAEYTVYEHNRNGELSGKVGVLKTDEKGHVVNELELYAGTYYIRETVASKGYELDQTIYKATVDAGATEIVKSNETPQKGKLELIKASKTPEWTDNNEHYSLEGAEYTVYHSYKDGNLSGKEGVLITDEKGRTKEPLELYAGTYYVKETKASKGFEADPNVYTVKVRNKETEVVTSYEKPKKGLLEIKKHSDAPEWTESNDQYSLADAEYTVYKTYENGTVSGKVGVLTTNQKGNSKSPLELYAGTYYVKETKAPKGFYLDQKVHKAEVKVGTSAAQITTTVDCTDKAKKGKLKLRKDSLNTGITDDNDCYSFTGAEYGVYRTKKDAASGSNRLEVLKTDQNGLSGVIELYGGDYFIKELKAPKGYSLDNAIYQLHVIIEQESMAVSHEEPKYGPVDLVLEKVDKTTGAKAPQGGASLEGAVFGVQYYDGYYETPAQAEASGKPVRTWILKTDASGEIKFDEAHFVEGDAYYTNLAKQSVLPLGTVTIKELIPPAGYKKNDQVFLRQITDDGSARPAMKQLSAPVVPDEIKRGDMKGVKIFDNTAFRGSKIVFRLTSVTTGESHILVADSNGRFSTAAAWAERDEKVNVNDAAIDETGKVQEELLDEEAGIWFSGTSPEKPENAAPIEQKTGALPYDEYVLDELPTSANADHKLLSGIHFIVRYDVQDLPERGLVELGTLTNDEKDVPELETTAVDQTTELHIGNAAEQVTIIDTVTYRGLEPGCEYTVRGTLMDKQTGLPVMEDESPVVKDVTFTAKKKNGKVEVPLTLSGSTVKGRTVVVFETLFENDVEIASHMDLEDEDQTVIYPEIGTRATLEKEGNKQFIIDTVSYNGLLPGHTYYMQASLHNPDDTELIDGKEMTVRFVPEMSKGHIDVKIDAEGLEGKTVVVYESCLTAKGVVIAEHNDPQCEDQTVTIDKPEEPEQPDEPEKPVVPEKPEKPVVPEKPEKPVVPEKPEKPVVPDKPEKPVVPDKPDKPVVPEKPHAPRTGDPSNDAALWMILMGSAAVCATLLFARRRDDNAAE